MQTTSSGDESTPHDGRGRGHLPPNWPPPIGCRVGREDPARPARPGMQMAPARWLTSPRYSPSRHWRPASASGAVTVGQTFVPTSSSTCIERDVLPALLRLRQQLRHPNQRANRLLEPSGRRQGPGRCGWCAAVGAAGRPGARSPKSAYRTITPTRSTRSRPTWQSMRRHHRARVAGYASARPAFFNDFSTYGSYGLDGHRGRAVLLRELMRDIASACPRSWSRLPFTPGSGGGGGGDGLTCPPACPDSDETWSSSRAAAAPRCA